jgi:hypothetical protein
MSQTTLNGLSTVDLSKSGRTDWKRPTWRAAYPWTGA